VYPFHVANTEYVVEAWLKSTRNQPAAPQVITEYPVAGVADTSVTWCAEIASTTKPPAVSYRASELLGEGVGEAGAEGEEGARDVPCCPGEGELPTGTCVLPDPSPACGDGIGAGLVPAPAASTAGGVSAAGMSTESTPSQATAEATAVAPAHAATASGARRVPPDALGPTGSLSTGHGLRCHAMANVLLVEDDPDVRSAVIHQLTAFGHAVRSAGTALAALREASRDPGDIIVLDLGLPDLDGSETLKMLRAITRVPVIIATARDDEAEIIRLLNAGADDYLVKPFSGGHLAARIAALLRRSGSGQAPSALRIGGLEVDPRRREARLDGQPLDLSRREFDLLAYLAARPGEVVTRRELLTEVWQLPYGDDQTIDVHLSWLRRKLGERASAPRYLHTVRGVGVRLTEPPR
jgi:DNA-binding response OmpR family regulator